jgi:glycosyltransferase involved in cell wall biosynthesis
VESIAILLTTYNSQLYIREQIDSILAQTETEWILYIRDDYSHDDTLKIINEYCFLYPEKIKLISDNFGRLGAGQGFMGLLERVEASYYMFCDHDDYWLPNKIEKTYIKMKILEKKFPEKPLMIFTNLCIVNKDLEIIAPSMWSYANINPEHAKNIYYLLASSTVTGCTMMLNQQVKNVVFPYPKEAIIHDWWIALILSQEGVVDYISEPTVLYRIHERNEIGIQKTKRSHYFKKLIKIKKTVKDNINVIKMINKLPFKVNHFKRFVVKLNVIFKKQFNIFFAYG